MKLLSCCDNFDRPAVITDTASYSYRELRKLVDACKVQLKTSLGLTQGDLVGLCVYRTIDLCVSMISLVELEVAFVPISPNFPRERINYIVSDSGIDTIITDRCSSKAVKGHNKLGESINLFVLGHGLQHSSKQKTCLQAPSSTGIAYVMYTSGSTGRPKGVMVSRSSMLSLFSVLAHEIGLSRKDVFLALTNYTFDISLLELLMPLYIGAGIYLASDSAILKGCDIKKILSSYPISVFQATPTTLRILLEAGWINSNPSIKVLCGGELLSVDLARALMCSNGNIWNVYGPTETTIWSSFYRLSKSDLLKEYIPIGRPFQNAVFCIFDNEGNLVEEEGEGELFIGGEGVAVGYLNNELLTNEKFINLENVGRLYKTGDIVKRLFDGNICYLGRIDDQIKIGGVRIEPAELERAAEMNLSVSRAVAKSYLIDKDKKGIHLFFNLDCEHLYGDVVSGQNLNLWCDIFDNAYSPSEAVSSHHLSSSGWTNSFTSEPLKEIELDENLSFLLSKLDFKHNDNVLEIGAGAGNLIKRILPSVHKYDATDSSTRSVDYLTNKLSRFMNEDRLSINKLFAHQISCSRSHKYVLMNSVIQYFPSKEYLDEVIDKCIEAVEDGGTLVIGDIRNAELLDLYVLEKAVRRQENKNIASKLYFKSRDSELLVNPQYFYHLLSEDKRVAHIDTNVKTGTHENDLNFYRYDLHVHINKNIKYVEPVYLNWEEFELKTPLESIDKPIVILRIPNILSDRILALCDLNGADKIRIFASQILKCNVKNHVGVHMKKLCALYSLAQHENVYIDYDPKEPREFLKMTVYPKGDGLSLVRCKSSYENEVGYVRQPYNETIQSEMIRQIIKNIQMECPEYMYPSMYCWVEKWPINESGKVDKNLLDLSPLEDLKLKGESEIEIELIKIWYNITGSCFDRKTPLRCFGISSLYFSFFASMIYKAYGIDLALKDLEGNMTISDIARLTKIKASCV